MAVRPRSSESVDYDLDGALKPIQRLEGRFILQSGNRLAYEVERSTGSDGRKTPQRIALDGSWKLSADDQLLLSLRQSGRHRRDSIQLKAALLKADAHSLTVAVGGGEAAQLLTLAGRWQADANNRLTFLIDRGQGTAQRLTFQGGWELGPHHEILYRLRRQPGRRGNRPQQSLKFAGAWDVTRKGRLVYQLEGSNDSAFEFRASLESPSIRAAEGRLAYQVGIQLSKSRTQRQRVVLFGKWKVNRDLSVSFEIPYAGGRVAAIRFEGRMALGGRSDVALALASSRGEPLGLSVLFTRKLFRDTRLFLRFKRTAEESSMIAGIQTRF